MIGFDEIFVLFTFCYHYDLTIFFGSLYVKVQRELKRLENGSTDNHSTKKIQSDGISSIFQFSIKPSFMLFLQLILSRIPASSNASEMKAHLVFQMCEFSLNALHLSAVHGNSKIPKIIYQKLTRPLIFSDSVNVVKFLF